VIEILKGVAFVSALSLVLAWFAAAVHFVVEFGRFPIGAGEVLNWVFGL
jgi:hypothetical protein